jgi:hypothetical protein
MDGIKGNLDDNLVAKGKKCTTCHKGQESKLGRLTISGKRIEPNPIPRKNSLIKLAVQAAYDSKTLYWRFSWKTNLNRPGQMHNYMRYDGKKWVFHGDARSSERVRSGTGPPFFSSFVVSEIYQTDFHDPAATEAVSVTERWGSMRGITGQRSNS